MRRFQLSSALFGLSALAAFATAADAQRRDRGTDISAEHLPPAGMCRIWINGLAPGLQPSPTDCANAERVVGENGRIIYGTGVTIPPLREPTPWCYGNDGRRVDCNRQNASNPNVSGDRIDETAEGRLDRITWDRYPKRLPDMVTAVQYRRGERPDQVRRWLGDRYLLVRTIDADNNGRPERVIWRNRREEVIQIWSDQNRDGRADRVEFYESGRRVRVIE
ncbi:MAG: hypothetical protein H7Z74_08200 [Anaerolineae bacterium]|nr:hypothetical protein [Gemmatimonadaceae bacterium]